MTPEQELVAAAQAAQAVYAQIRQRAPHEALGQLYVVVMNVCRPAGLGAASVVLCEQQGFSQDGAEEALARRAAKAAAEDGASMVVAVALLPRLQQLLAAGGVAWEALPVELRASLERVGDSDEVRVVLISEEVAATSIHGPASPPAPLN